MHSKVINWALNTLQNLGYIVKNPTPVMILHTSWSMVYRFDTDQGYCYLKQVPPGLSSESQVITLLKKTCSAPVPILIAENLQEHCFLMKNAGIPLREYLKQNFDVNVILAAIHEYIAVQQKSISHLEHLFQLSASDWRVANIPNCYTALINQKDLLIADGLTDKEIALLSKLTPKLALLCEQLSQYPIPDTFSHNDFHDNNLLIDPKTKKVTMVDLGEVAVTHPLFSLLNILHHIKENHALHEEAYQHLQQHSLRPWLDYASQDQLAAMMSIMQQCWPIHRALTEYRLLTSVDQQAAQKLLGQGRFFRNLRVWLSFN